MNCVAMEPDTSPLTPEITKRTETISSKSRNVHWAPGDRSSSKDPERQDAEEGGSSALPNVIRPKHQYFGPDVLIILGFALLLLGLGLTVYGLNTTFALLEIEISVMGIGPSLIAIGIVFLLLRILYCKTLYVLINRLKKISITNVIHPQNMDKSMQAQQSGATVTVSQQSKSALVEAGPYIGSPNKAPTESMAKEETADVSPSGGGSLDSKAVASLSENNSGTASQDYVMDELEYLSSNVDMKDASKSKISFHKNRNEDETILLVQKLNDRRNSIEYYREFNETVNELGLSV